LRVFWVQSYKKNLWRITSVAVGEPTPAPPRRGTHPYPSQEGIFCPYNFVSNATNHTVDPEDPKIYGKTFSSLV
jgi:hypothetical protein